MGTYSIRINGNARTVSSLDPNQPLLYVLRGLGLTATKFGCGLGQDFNLAGMLHGRVNPDMLERQKLPPSVVNKGIWERRFKEINAFERHVAWNGTLILKFHLRISKEEQRKRFLARLEEPIKRWKFSMGDVTDRQRWDEYMTAYEDMIRSTSTEAAPWYVVPADHKHIARVVVCAAICEAMETLKLDYPKIEGKALKELEAAERALKAEKPDRSGKIKRKK